MNTAGYMTTTEAAAYIRACEETVRRLIRSGRLRAVRIGRVWRTRIEWLDECLLSRAGLDPQALEFGSDGARIVTAPAKVKNGRDAARTDLALKCRDRTGSKGYA